MSPAPLYLVNNTGEDIDAVAGMRAAIVAATQADGVLCDELADLFVLTKIDGYPNRWRLDFA